MTTVGVFAAIFDAWEPDAEIAEAGFFAQDALPQPMHPFTATRIRDAFEGRLGMIRVLETLD